MPHDPEIGEYDGYDPPPEDDPSWRKNPVVMLLGTVLVIGLIASWILAILQVTGVTDFPFHDLGWFGPP